MGVVVGYACTLTGDRDDLSSETLRDAYTVDEMLLG